MVFIVYDFGQEIVFNVVQVMVNWCVWVVLIGYYMFLLCFDQNVVISIVEMVWCFILFDGFLLINNGVGNVRYVEIGSCCSGCNGVSFYKVMMIEFYGVFLFCFFCW